MRKKNFSETRRRFFGMTASGVVAGALPASASWWSKSARRANTDGIKLAVNHIFHPYVTDDMLVFMKAMGIEAVEGEVSKGYDSYEEIVKFRQRIEDAGLRLIHVGYSGVSNAADFHLALPGRDELIDRFQAFVRNLGKAGIGYTTYAWTPGKVFRTGTTETRGCKTDVFDETVHRQKPLVRDRDYSDEELWANYRYFMDAMLPVAQEANVKLAFHPGDPPIDFNIPRLFRSNEMCERALKMYDSPYSGVKFCVGTWAEMPGPDGKGEDVIGAIRRYGKAGKIFGVHFRNISAPLPVFHETFPDNGYLNMYEIMKALVEVGFTGGICPDHVPVVPGEKRLSTMGASGTAFSIGYMRALLDAVKSELA